MVPRAIFRDPFRGGDNILVMTDTYKPPKLMSDGFVTPMVPLPTNTRAACAEIMERFKDAEPWFGIEQVWNNIMSAPTGKKAPLGIKNRK
jgi:glutamine synthetase